MGARRIQIYNLLPYSLNPQGTLRSAERPRDQLIRVVGSVWRCIWLIVGSIRNVYHASNFFVNFLRQPQLTRGTKLLAAKITITKQECVLIDS